MKGEDRPSGAFILSAIGLVFHAVAFVAIVLAATVASGLLASRFPIPEPGYMEAVVGWFLL